MKKIANISQFTALMNRVSSMNVSTLPVGGGWHGGSRRLDEIDAELDDLVDKKSQADYDSSKFYYDELWDLLMKERDKLEKMK